MTDFVLIHGSNATSPTLARRSGWHYGVCSKDKAYGRCWMLDYDWTQSTAESWQKHVAMLYEHKPHQSVVIDYEYEEQYDLMNQRIEDCVTADVVPIVVPKFTGATYQIPLYAGVSWQKMHRVIIGVSVPTSNDKFSGWLPTWKEVSGRPLHLLGGHPDQWNWLRHYYKHSTVASIDANSMIRAARDYGKFWRRDGWGYREVRGLGYSTNAIAVYSMRNAVRYWQSGHINETCQRVMLCRQMLGLTPLQPRLF